MIVVENNFKEPHLSAAITTILKLSKDLQIWEENNLGYSEEKIARVVVTGEGPDKKGFLEIHQLTVVCNDQKVREMIEGFLNNRGSLR